nr:l10-interacting myb domain-containing protein [Quercus suber]
MAESTVSYEELGLWPDSVEKMFIFFLLEEAINGNTRYKWEAVTAEFNNQNGKSYSIQQIYDKYKRLKARFTAFTHLLGRPDMKHDINTNTFTGSKEAWSDAIKTYRRCGDFVNKGLAYYPLLKDPFLRDAPASTSQQVGATYADRLKNISKEAINGNTRYKWEAVTAEFNNQNGKSYSIQQIYDKYKRLKARFTAFTHLLGRPDMKHDINTNTFTGSKEAWSDAIKVWRLR